MEQTGGISKKNEKRERNKVVGYRGIGRGQKDREIER